MQQRQPLAESLAMFTYAGVWQPLNWKPDSLRAGLYGLYTLLSICLVYSLTLSELAGALLLTNSLGDFTDVSFLLLSTISVCCKTASIVKRRAEVAGLLSMLRREDCLPRNDREAVVLAGFDRLARFTAVSCLVLAETTVAIMSMGPLFQDANSRVLPFKSWLPYKLTSSSRFWLSYVHQTAAIVICATINVANDSLLCGFLVQTCSQLELLNRRLLELPKIVERKVTSSELAESLVRTFEAKIMSTHIRHHNHILTFAKNINIVFTPVILVQFCMSSIVLSLTIYQLSVNSVNGIQIVTLTLYLSCMLVQFFMYCWFGNEVTLKSLDFGQTLYNTDWISLRHQTNKDLIIMMLRAKRPIIISCGSMITLSIKSFTTILKTSYSAFNVLTRSSS